MNECSILKHVETYETDTSTPVTEHCKTCINYGECNYPDCIVGRIVKGSKKG